MLEEVRSLFQSSSSDCVKFEAVLPGLNSAVIRTSQDEDYRQSLASSEDLWRTIGKCCEAIEDFKLTDIDESLRFWALRIFRGVVLLARNLCVSNQEIPQKLLLREKLSKSFNIISNAGFRHYDEIEWALYATLIEFSCNITADSVTFDLETLEDTLKTLTYPINEGNECTESLLISYTLFLRNLTTHSDFVYYLLKSDEVTKILYNHLLLNVTFNYTPLQKIMQKQEYDDHDLSTLTNVVISTYLNICCHESFAPFLSQMEASNPEMFMNFLKISHLLTTSFESWDKYQLTGILSWSFKIFEALVEEIGKHFQGAVQEESRAALLHGRLLIILDMFTTLAQYEHVREFFAFYNGLDMLIELLHIFQKNLVKLNIYKSADGTVTEIRVKNSRGEKVTDTNLIEARVDCSNGSIKATNFPECKLLIIEIISFLVHENSKMQNRARELQGLEAVLSNCVIDDNDPFIKERSVMCIKHLLKDNPENQNIVAQLESKAAIQDDALESAGYEVSVDGSGKIKLGYSDKK